MPILGIIDAQKISNLNLLVGSYYSLATVTVPSGGSSSVAFTNIPSDYRDLRIVANYLTSADVALFRFNETNGSSTDYDFHGIRANGSTASAYAITNAAHVQIGTGLGSSSTIYSLLIDILDYQSSTKNKVIRFTYGYDTNGAGQIEFVSGLWRSTAPITSIQLPAAAGNISQHSSFALYGVK